MITRILEKEPVVLSVEEIKALADALADGDGVNRHNARERLEEANHDVTRFTEAVNSLQLEANDNTQKPYSAARTRQLDRLQENQQKLAEAQQRLEDLQDEGRRKRFR